MRRELNTYRLFWLFQLLGWGLFFFILTSGLIGCSPDARRIYPKPPYCDLTPKPKWC